MKRLMALLLIAAAAQGCSIYKAATAPPSVSVDNVKVGSSRAQVMAVLGLPRSTEVGQMNERTDVFEFIDGNSESSKLRIVPYIAADLFTVGLAELILWPVELSLLQGSEGRAVVTFDQESRAKTVMVTKKDGTPWKSE